MKRLFDRPARQRVARSVTEALARRTSQSSVAGAVVRHEVVDNDFSIGRPILFIRAP
jgi:hypothetical protein